MSYCLKKESQAEVDAKLIGMYYETGFIDYEEVALKGMQIFLGYLLQNLVVCAYYPGKSEDSSSVVFGAVVTEEALRKYFEEPK